MDDVQLLVQNIVAQAKQLGITWTLRPGVVIKANSVSTATVLLDGDEFNIIAVNILGQTNLGSRVMCLIIPNQAVYIIGRMNKYVEAGELVCRVRQTTNQSIPDAGAGTFLDFDSADYDPFGFFRTATPNRVTPKFPGWYNCQGRVVWTANATSRRGAFVNMNNTTGGTGTLGGTSLQAPATGSAQLHGGGAGLFNGTSDFVGLRAIQNSGVALTTSGSTDGGSILEIYYAGPGRV